MEAGLRTSTILSMSRTAWFEDARFGLSFHWGVASVPGRGDGWLRSGRILASGAPVAVGNYWNAGVQRFDQPDDQFINLAEPIGGTYLLPDADDTVLELETTRDLAVLAELDARLARAVARVPNP
jgi:hypothetical protein